MSSALRSEIMQRMAAPSPKPQMLQAAWIAAKRALLTLGHARAAQTGHSTLDLDAALAALTTAASCTYLNSILAKGASPAQRQLLRLLLSYLLGSALNFRVLPKWHQPRATAIQILEGSATSNVCILSMATVMPGACHFGVVLEEVLVIAGVIEIQ